MEISEVVQFIFRGFWTWLGSMIFITVVISGFFNGIAIILRAFTGNYPPVEKKEEEK
jgi:hypothetical protein